MDNNAPTTDHPRTFIEGQTVINPPIIDHKNPNIPLIVISILLVLVVGFITGIYTIVIQNKSSGKSSGLISNLVNTTSTNSVPVPTTEQKSSIILSPTIPVVTPITISEGNLPKIGNCTVFPGDNPWNQDISQYPVSPLSKEYISIIGTQKSLHPDFGGVSYGKSWGIPYITVNNSQMMYPITFTAYGDESDPGPYPIPLNAPIEGGSENTGDRHVLAVNTDTCILYELYRAFPTQTGWSADSGAVFDLNSNKLRPERWTSADAAGLPIFPGLVKFDEVSAGNINHAIRFTTRNTQRGYIHPAVHFASTKNDQSLPPMGLRVRLKADYDINNLPPQAKVIAKAMKKYGMILADNGGDWFFQGETNKSWDDEDINSLKSIPGSAFEAVDTGPVIH